MSRKEHPSVRRFSWRPGAVPKTRQVLGMSTKEAKAHASRALHHPDLTTARARAMLKRFEKTL
jgi:hypothetical protein